MLESESLSGVLWLVVLIVAVVILIAQGAFFASLIRDAYQWRMDALAWQQDQLAMQGGLGEDFEERASRASKRIASSVVGSRRASSAVSAVSAMSDVGSVKSGSRPSGGSGRRGSRLDAGSLGRRSLGGRIGSVHSRR